MNRPEFDPWTASLARLDQAWCACLRELTGAGHLGLVRVHEALERRREQVAAGDTLAVLQALGECARWNLPAPAWLAEAFTSRLEAFTSCTPGPGTRDTLDDLFRTRVLRAGQPVRTRKDRADWALGSQLWAAVRVIAHRHRGLHPALQEVLAAGRWPVNLRRAGQLVRLVDATHAHLTSGGIAPLSVIWSKSCKRSTHERKPGEMTESRQPRQ